MKKSIIARLVILVLTVATFSACSWSIGGGDNKGDTGATGASGAPGPTGPTGATGSNNR
jgi:uncharacterized lipoprotein